MKTQTTVPDTLASKSTVVQPVHEHREVTNMLWTIFVILMIMWLLGMVTSYTLGGFIHILLLLALITVLIRVIQGRPV